MAQITSAIAAKRLRKLNDERDALLTMEQKSRTFVAALQEDVESVRPAYDYKATQEKLTKLEGKIRRLKHAINCFNSTYEIPEFDMTIMFLIPANNPVFLIGISAVIGITMCSGNICTGMLSDCIEYGDYQFGIREEGLTYAFMSFGVKLATAVTGTVTVLMLSAIGYVPNAEQTEAVKTGINAVVNLLPAAVVLLSSLPLFWYKLNKNTMAEITAKLDERNAKK
jgi:Na+/melibiose symporter-like transporter